MTKKILAGFVGLVAFTGIALGLGNWFGLPIIGGASYCSTTVNGSCTQTVPAGPTAVTGSELVPADTQLSQGRSPQTAYLSMRALNAAPITYNLCAAATCGTVQVGDNAGGVLLDYSTTITSATVNLPLLPMDGQQVSIASAFTVSTLAVTATGTGQSLAVTTPTVLTASTTVPQGYKYVYVAASLKWYRVY